VEGQLMAQPSNKCKKTYWPASRQKKGPIPLPGPAFYHSVSSKWDYPCDEGTVSCLNLIPHHLTQSLEKNLDSLLHQKALDLHPGSDGQVVDLIHPSLYPYINGVTTVTDEEEFKLCEEIDGDYCWLPSEFDVDASGCVTIESYINNLDRSQHPSLYLDIAQVFQTMLPLFEDITGLSLTSKKLQVIVKAAYYFIPPGETYLGVCSSLCLQFSSLISLCLSLSLCTGSWHVEGMPHENIIASGIYYIAASENIINNHLAFRRLNDEHRYYGEHGREGEEVELVEDIGAVDTPTGTVLVWKNDLQHQVGPLTVQDEPNEQPNKKKKSTTPAVPSSPPVAPSTGIRKILCFFLVSPANRIVSTKIVPEQQNILSLEEAMEHRQNLMNERKYIAKRDAEDWESRTYTFCEH
jgi:hypothetical protein